MWLGFRALDAAYITSRYAVNLASGFGFVYNIGERLGTFGSIVAQAVTAKVDMAGHPALRRFSWLHLALFFLKGQYGGDIFERTYLQLMPVATTFSSVAAMALLSDVIRARNDLAVRRALALRFFPACYVAGLALSHAFTFFPWYYGPIYPLRGRCNDVGCRHSVRGRQTHRGFGMRALVSGQLATAWLVKLPADRSYWVVGYMEAADLVPRDPDVRVAALEIGAVGWRVARAHPRSRRAGDAGCRRGARRRVCPVNEARLCDSANRQRRGVSGKGRAGAAVCGRVRARRHPARSAAVLGGQILIFARASSSEDDSG